MTGVRKAMVCTILSVIVHVKDPFKLGFLKEVEIKIVNIHILGVTIFSLLELRMPSCEREMFYLMTHSTHFIYDYMASDMVKDHSDSEKGNSLPPHRLLLSINSKGYFICTIPQTG